MTDEVVQYLIHPALREKLDAWLASQGLRVDRLPAEVEGDDSLPTFLVAPTDELMASVPFVTLGNNEPIPEHWPEELKTILREMRGEA